ncbi:hydrogen peroxide-inducible genes activator [Flaviaesturariibacter amylovorans]|uniref:Hydrogen peroxide-inducible genes activator n=1 Tax=Flaviaesturariibacter amylovorans TaxID=1084520 RepID=A0ABP8HCM9_9BACT
MNLQQLEYITALDTHRHFGKAAAHCFVAQATLSMMIKKLEEELGVVLFDRSRAPIVPTEAGVQVIAQARATLREAAQIPQLAREMRSGVQGELRVGIIPTLAPYLLPLFLPGFLKDYPQVHLRITEQTTAQQLHLLATDALDVGIMATPLAAPGMKETPLFREPFRVFVANDDKSLRKKFLLPEDLDVNQLWLLEEGHCLRSQVLNLCELQQRQARAQNLDYEAGSIESLINITEMNGGITILPELATRRLSPEHRERLRAFRPPVPAREISLVTYRHFVKKKLLEVFEKAICASVAPILGKDKGSEVIPL